MIKKIMVNVIFILLVTMAFANEKIGEITLLEGQVTIQRDNSNKNAEIGDVVFDSDIIATSKDSIAEIKLVSNKGVVTINKNSKLSMSIFKENEKTHFSISLFFGTIKNKVTKEQSEYYNVTTPSVTLGVRGTEFEVTSNITGESYVNLIDGEITAIDNPDDKDIEADLEEDADNAKKRINEITLKKGEKIEKNNEIDKITKTDKENKDEWLNDRQQYFKKNEKKSLFALEKKTEIIGKQLKKINKVSGRIGRIQGKINKIFIRVDKTISKNKYLSKEQKETIKSNLNEESKETVKSLNKITFRILNSTRILLDEYWACKEMLNEFARRVDNKEQEIKDHSTYNRLKTKIKRLEKLDKEAKKFEKIWKDLTQEING